MSHDHKHLVTLKGYCPRKSALVYEHMEGGTLLGVILEKELR